MAKKSGTTSWLTVVKKAFRSPTKDSEKKSCRRRDENHEQEDEEKVTIYTDIYIYIIVI